MTCLLPSILSCSHSGVSMGFAGLGQRLQLDGPAWQPRGVRWTSFLAAQSCGESSSLTMISARRKRGIRCTPDPRRLPVVRDAPLTTARLRVGSDRLVPNAPFRYGGVALNPYSAPADSERQPWRFRLTHLYAGLFATMAVCVSCIDLVHGGLTWKLVALRAVFFGLLLAGVLTERTWFPKAMLALCCFVWLGAYLTHAAGELVDARVLVTHGVLSVAVLSMILLDWPRRSKNSEPFYLDVEPGGARTSPPGSADASAALQAGDSATRGKEG